MTDAGDPRRDDGSEQAFQAGAFAACAPWLDTLPECARRRLVLSSRERCFEPGELVGKHGAPAVEWVGVVQGLLKAQIRQGPGKKVLLACVPEGSWVGEGSIVRQTSRPYDLVAATASRVRLVPAGVVQQLLDDSLEFNRLIMLRIAERLSQHLRMLEIDRMADPVVRVARGIANLYNPVLHPLLGPALPLSQKDIGELTGMSRQSVGEALKKLQSRGLLSIKYGGLVIQDLAGLASADKDDFRERRNHLVMDSSASAGRSGFHFPLPYPTAVTKYCPQT